MRRSLPSLVSQFKPCSDNLHSKAIRAIFALNRIYKFHKLLVDMSLKRFDILILLILLCGSEVWKPYRGYNFSTWDKIYSFLKGFSEF